MQAAAAAGKAAPARSARAAGQRKGAGGRGAAAKGAGDDANVALVGVDGRGGGGKGGGGRKRKAAEGGGSVVGVKVEAEEAEVGGRGGIAAALGARQVRPRGGVGGKGVGK